MLRDDEEVTGVTEQARTVGPRERTLTLCVVCSALFLALLDSTVVALALPTVREDLNAGLTGLQRIVLGYVCPYAALLLTGGFLGDRFGRRRVFLAGTAVFTAGSPLCAAAESVTVLAAGRAVQGVGAAAVTPQTLALLSQVFPGERTEHPALRLDFFRGRAFAGATSVTFLMGVALNAAYLVLSLLLQVLEGASPAGAGMRLLPTMAAIVAGAVLAGRAQRLLAPWQLVAAGTAVAGASLLTVAATAAGHPYAVWWPGAAAMGLGMGLVMSPNNGAMIGGVRPEDTGQAAAMGGVLQQAGSLLGVASLGAVLGSSVLDGHTAAAPARAVLATGLRHGLLLAGVCCLLATAATLLLTRPRDGAAAGAQRPV